MDFTNKHILVFGLAKSGLAAIRLLHQLNAQITLVEKKDLSEDPSFDYLNSIHVRIEKMEPDVFKRPYDLCVKNPGIPYRSEIMDILAENHVKVITEIELGFLAAKPQHYCAITGSNGKTTTTTLLYEILKNAYGDKAHVCGNIGTPLCDVVVDEDLLHQQGHYIALELSNYQLVCNDQFKAETACIINLSPDHIEFHGTLEEYYRSKTMIYKNMTSNDCFIVNEDDSLIKEYMGSYPCSAHQETFSLNDVNADACIKNDAIYIHQEKILPLSCVKVVGKHNLQNILVAASMAKQVGVSNEIIRKTVSEFNGVEHRIEFVREINGVRYYNDSKGTNTDATITALKSFDQGVILLVGGYEKGLPMDELKKHLGCTKQIIGFGKCGPRLIHELTNDKGILVDNLQEALCEANKIAQSGDTVLLSPTTSSFDQYSCFEERGDHFKKLVWEL